MPIEPHNAITLKTPRVGKDHPRSVADYRAALAARFGGRVPSLSELAKFESGRAGKTWLTDRNNGGGPRLKQHLIDQQRMEWALQIAQLPVVTRATAAKAWGVLETTAANRFFAFANSGLATRIPGTKPVQWQIHVTRMEAAE